MIRVAIPTFQKRVSPVIDSCQHVLIVDIDSGAPMPQEKVFMGDMSLPERCRIFRKLNVAVVICGGISETFARMLKSYDMRLINGIAGEVKQVLTAFVGGHLDDPYFYMPGFRADDKAL